MNKKISIVIVEDHPVFRMGLCKIINQESDMMVVGEAEDVHNGFTIISKLKPDAAIIDISLKDSNGIELVKDIARHFPVVKTLVLSMHDEKIYAQRVLQDGASGYIMKDKTSDVIVEAIRTILDGSIYVSEQIMKEIVAKAVKNEYGLSPVDILTNRELAIFALIGKGKTTREIAATLNLSSKTIGTYKERIKEKLHIKNAVQLVNEATRWVHETEENVSQLPTNK